MDDKIIVTNRAALAAKYGASGIAAIRKALASLVAADRKRGVATRIVYLDDPKAMKKLRGKAVADAADVRGAKAAVDAIHQALTPEYLLIIGSIDVVPHQDVKNPAYAAGDDDDAVAYGDLPYACDTPYGTDAAQFVGPTRVVGRLPDLTGAKEPSHLLALLKTAAGWKRRPAADFSSYFGLSAAVWQGSTRLSLDNIFGSHAALKLAPPSGPRYPASQLGTLMHFINCHGGPAAPEFYGQKARSYPVSLDTKATAKAIAPGTVASIECCYGGQLYDSITLGLDMPICQSYLAQGCYGYFGSTTIAYGPADANGAADLICQYFLLNVLSGASVGRAALMARQQFVAHAAQMDPIDLKTLAQFCLYGDPSVHPVESPDAVAPVRGEKLAGSEQFRRRERRAKLRETGEFLQRTKPTASRRHRTVRPSATAKSTLVNLAAKAGLPRDQAFTAYRVEGVPHPRGSAAKVASAPTSYYLTIGKPKPGADNTGRYRIAVVAKELAGRIIDYCIYHER
jgi:hypothetical protein